MVIEARDLSKDYIVHVKGKGMKGMVKSLFHSEIKEVHAVQNINLSMEEGELVGYIGPNGAGKSTTIKMLTGILQPTAGSVRVCGIDPAKKRIENAMNIGAVFGQKTQLWWDLPVRETFELLKRMYSIPEVTYQRNIDDFMEFLDMAGFMDQPVRQLSLGQRMRAEIAASLLHDPKVLFLDEPTIGLDINVKIRMRKFIKKINEERGVSIILTTHDLADIESLAKRIVVINHGTLCFDGSMEELKEHYAGGERRIRFTLQQEISGDFSEILKGRLGPEMAGAIQISMEGRHVQVRHPHTIEASDILGQILSLVPISDISVEGPQIEDVVMEVYNS